MPAAAAKATDGLSVKALNTPATWQEHKGV